jgi:hypothetical protein
MVPAERRRGQGSHEGFASLGLTMILVCACPAAKLSQMAGACQGRAGQTGWAEMIIWSGS